MKKVSIYILLILIFKTYSFAQNADNKTITENIKYSNYYNFINYDINYIEWYNTEVADSFFTKLSQCPDKRFTVLHIGDSHLQADFFAGKVRNSLQNVFGEAGRGFFFLYKAAGTHSAYDYITRAEGEWEHSRNVEREVFYPLGISGVTIFTEDSSATANVFFRKQALNTDNIRLRVWCKKHPNSYNLSVNSPAFSSPIIIDCQTEDSLLYTEYILPKATDTLQFSLIKDSSNQHFVELYGFSIDKPDDKGILYNSVGINGAGYYSLLKQDLFTKQLKVVNPNLVVLDLGANDFYKSGLNNTQMKINAYKIIDSIRSVCPNALIMLTNSQDIYFRSRNIGACEDYSELTREMAIEKSCLFYDWYKVAGGRYSMINWEKNRLSNRDRVHLLSSGYYTKGEMITAAWLNSYNYWENNRDSILISDSNIMDTTYLKQFFINQDFFFNQPKPAIDSSNNYEYIEPEGDGFYYVVASGDNLGFIAEKFGVGVSEIQMWNGIYGTRIDIGQKLLIYPKKKENIINNNTNIVNNNNTDTNKKNNDEAQESLNKKRYEIALSKAKVIHTVASGDNLWSISSKYKTTVEHLKEINFMSSDNLNIGQKIIIK